MTERAMELKLAAQLREIAGRLKKKLELRGGRGVALAERVDRLELAADALEGDAYCNQCGAQIAGHVREDDS